MVFGCIENNDPTAEMDIRTTDDIIKSVCLDINTNDIGIRRISKKGLKRPGH